MKNFFKQITAYCHEPIQIFLATTWLLCGLFMIVFNSPVIQGNIPYNLNFMGFGAQGLLLVLIALLGFYGVWKHDRRADFIFACFSVFKNTVLTLELMAIAIDHPEWIPFSVRALASIILFNKAIHNLRYKL